MSAQNKKPHLEPWKIDISDYPKEGSIQEKIKYILGYAILAPSGHNSQPWLFDIKRENLLIFADASKGRPVVDPEMREMYISMGCAMKNLEVAANFFGLRYIRSIDAGNSIDEPVASYIFSEASKKEITNSNSKDLEVIIKRHTNRGEYELKELPARVIEKIRSISSQYKEVGLKIITKESIKIELGHLVYQSIKAWYRNKELVREMDKWLKEEDDATDGMKVKSLNLPKIIKDFDSFLSTDYYQVESKATKDQELVKDASAIAIIYSKTDNRNSWIKTGMLYEELALEITKNRVHNAFFNGVIELKTQKQKLKEILNLKGEPQLFFRLGYGRDLDHTSRRPVDKVLINS